MIDADDVKALERGCCSRTTAAEKGCALCVPKYAAIDKVIAMQREIDRLRDLVLGSVAAAQHWAAFP